MRTRFVVAATVVILVTCLCAPGNSAQETRFLKFKRAMMPKVGEKVSVEGKLLSAKLGYFVETDNWGVYIYASNDPDLKQKNAASLKKMNDLSSLLDHRVTATGTLRYHPGEYSKRKDVAGIPEHFYFYAGEVEVIAEK